MIRKFSYLFVIFGLLGFLTLIPGVMDGAIYYYFRATNGDTIDINNQCFSVPEKWVIDSVEDRNGRTIYNLRKKEGEQYIFASVFYGDGSSIPGIQNLVPVKRNGDLFSIYELSVLPAGNTVRYWSFVSSQSLIIIGRRLSVLESLSLAIRPSD
ncbi:MAG: hypothetical protein ABFS45_01200 [Pseudomonadota bacterium]